jgi:ribosomal protein S18 acetylase RimI-like enzyme
VAEVIQLPRLRIAPLEEGQLDEAAVYLRKSWHDQYAKSLPRGLVKERTVAHFLHHLELRKDCCWLAWMGERLAGLVTSTANCIEDIWVTRRYRRRGIATRLIDTASHRLMQRGFGYVQVGCESFNPAAIGLFEHLGWQEIGAEPVEIGRGMRTGAKIFNRALNSERADTR